MTQDEIKWPVVYSCGMVVEYEPADDFGTAYFGGPLEQTFSGTDFGPEPLHRIFTFSPGKLPQPKGHYLQGALSLFYGMRYDGCNLRYRIPVKAGVKAQYIEDYNTVTEIISISPSESNQDWPYLGYPQLLPYIPLKQRSQISIAPEEFSNRFTWQGLDDISENDLIIIIPAISRLGVSMWGRMGDSEAVQLVFRYNYVTHEVQAYNQCT